MNENMKHFYIIQQIILLITCGLGFCVVGCSGDIYYDDFPLSDYVEVVIQSVEEQDDAGKETNTELKIKACLINKTADEIELFFNSRQTLCAGGFRIHIGTEMYSPDMDFGEDQSFSPLPGHGRREFTLIFELPKAQAQHVLAAPETMQVIMMVYGVHYKGKDYNIYGPHHKIIGQWKK